MRLWLPLRLRSGTRPGNAVAGPREAVATLRARTLLPGELLTLGGLRLLALGGAVRRVRSGLTGLTGLGRLSGLARVHRLSGVSGLSGVFGLPRLGRGVGLCVGLLVLPLALLVRGGRLREAVAAWDGRRPRPRARTARAGRGLGPGCG
ncbi:hypothetical protein SVIO_076980 [Streptomyces violaceusniger]|uniref:Uncharacterized protein n=1 Tax=Streptomyces violaceusniger TaxID=68280 RepID=A0A4D4L7J9_STRVO|nr:hypothetical protein SVIO_076980 [Streptomyces violaceusniger]